MKKLWLIFSVLASGIGTNQTTKATDQCTLQTLTACPPAGYAGQGANSACTILNFILSANTGPFSCPNCDLTDFNFNGDLAEFASNEGSGFSSLTNCNGKTLADFLNNQSNINLQGADLRGANLSGLKTTHINLTGANLGVSPNSGAPTNLTNINFQGASLTGTNLTGANLTGAILYGADMTGATLAKTNLTNADFTEGHFEKAVFYQANVSGTSFKGADLTMLADTILLDDGSNQAAGLNTVQNLNSPADFTNANMYGIDLSNAKIGHFEASNANLQNANLSGSDFSCNQSNPQCGSMFFGTNLTGANLAGANLQTADFGESIITGADFTKANLTGASLNQTSCFAAKFDQSTMTNTSMVNANCFGGKAITFGTGLGNTTFINTNISGVNFYGSNLNGTVFNNATITNSNFGDRTGQQSPASLIHAFFNGTLLNTVDFSSVKLNLSDFSNAGVGSGTPGVPTLSINTNTNFEHTTGTDTTTTNGTAIPLWIAKEMSTDTWGDYMSAQCQAGSQLFCGSFCEMSTNQYDWSACHPFEWYNINIDHRCVQAAPDEMNTQFAHYCDTGCCKKFVYGYSANGTTVSPLNMQSWMSGPIYNRSTMCQILGTGC